MSIVEDAGHGAGLGVHRGVPREMERNLAMQRGLRLKRRQEHFRETLQGIKVAMREMGFEVGGLRVSMQSGRIRDRHRPGCCLLSSCTASRALFDLKCRVGRSGRRCSPSS
ncbi:hypothetical protein GCM10008960_34930 [Deinococcus sedimenti]|uniref:Uncharacterized protein n=1 Tax=Deinococcus sedimenti TaxID=1867090 RepID=A0ABQ2S8D8_9DEIO|nr:hypothetical protein GCM10008960_34930 [Deinococcus sedimenti]